MLLIAISLVIAVCFGSLFIPFAKTFAVEENVEEVIEEPKEEVEEEPTEEVTEEPKEEPVEEPTEEPVEKKYGKVVIENFENGKVGVDILEGEVGSIVTITAKPNFLYSIKDITVNGLVVVPDGDELYKFALIEGDNIVAVRFDISQEELAYLVDIAGKAKDGDWGDIFSMSNLSTIINWVLSAVFSGAFLITLVRYKKLKNTNSDEITKKVVDKVTAANRIELTTNNKALLVEVLDPLITKMSAQMSGVEDLVKVLARCMLLAQENTPEARLAIVAELTDFKASSETLSDQVKGIIDAELEKVKEAELKTQKTLEELEQANEAIEVEEDASEKEYNSYGQI